MSWRGGHARFTYFYFIFVCRLIADLNFVTVSADAANTRALVVAVSSSSLDTEVFSGKFIFDDTIRCVAGRQV